MGSGIAQGPDYFSPNPVVGGHVFIDLAVSQSHTCAVTTDGAAYCWGAGFFGDGFSRKVTAVPFRVPEPG
jgi:alpha-tubulin suppressor-like RCC1 family protein